MKRTFSDIYESVVGGKVFDSKSVDVWVKKLKDGLKMPYVEVSKSELGGVDNVSIMIKMSFDKREDWGNKIYQNSKFLIMHLYNNGRLELVASGIKKDVLKYRVMVVKDVDDCLKKMMDWLLTVMGRLMIIKKEEFKYE